MRIVQPDKPMTETEKMIREMNGIFKQLAAEIGHNHLAMNDDRKSAKARS